MFWDRFIISNRDSTLYVYETGKVKIDDLPRGEYTITLNSMFNGKITKLVTLKKRTRIRFNAKNYYQTYKDSVSLLDMMKVKDTIKFYYEKWSCFGGPTGYGMVTKDSMIYKITAFNENDSSVSAYLNSEDINDFKKRGKYKPPPKRITCYIPGQGGMYYLVYKEKSLYKYGEGCSCYIYTLLREKGILK
jgi:hypothetical protein